MIKESYYYYRMLYGRYAANIYTYIIISIPPLPHSFIPGLNLHFLHILYHRSLRIL